MDLLGIVIALGAMIWLAFRGWSIVIIARAAGRCMRQDTQGGLAANSDAYPRGNLTTTMNPTV